MTVYTLAELPGLERCNRERLRETVERLELLEVLADLLKITSGPEGLEAIRWALEHRREQLKVDHDRAACEVCRALDQVPR